MHLHFAIAIIVWMTSLIAEALNVVTSGPVVITQFFDLFGFAGMIGVVTFVVWRAYYSSAQARFTSREVRIIFAGLIGNNLGLMILVIVVTFISQDKAGIILCAFTANGVAIAVISRRIVLRRMGLLREQTITTT